MTAINTSTIPKTIIYIEDDPNVRGITTQLLKSASKSYQEMNVESFSSTNDFHKYLQKQNREDAQNLLIISDGNLDKGADGKYKKDFNGIKELLIDFQTWFKATSSNFLLCYGGGSPYDFFNSFKRFEPSESNEISPIPYKLNSTKDDEIVIMPKPYGLKKFTALLECFDSMIRMQAA